LENPLKIGVAELAENAAQLIEKFRPEFPAVPPRFLERDLPLALGIQTAGASSKQRRTRNLKGRTAQSCISIGYHN